MRRLSVVAALMLLLSGTVTASDWWETVKVKGDLRYRHEMIDEAEKDARHRHRFRARLAVTGKVSERTTIGIQLASGSDDPVSTNQTLGDAFTTKTVGIDLAYFETSHEAFPGLTLTGGKFKNPFHKPGSSELMWDSDWNPEGGALEYQKTMEHMTVTLVGSGLWIQERSSSDDSWLGAAQGVLRFDLNDKQSSVTIGGGYFSYANTEGFAPFWDDGDSFGNTVVMVPSGSDTAMVYNSDYNIAEVFAEYATHVQNVPVSVIGDFVTNTAADSLDQGWLIGLYAGTAKKPGSWDFRYIYREVEADAVLGLFTDSDFRGGGTDAKGHEIGATYMLDEKTAFGATYFANTIGLEGDEEDFGRLQVDLQLSF